jgi:hypothetical protein
LIYIFGTTADPGAVFLSYKKASVMPSNPRGFLLWVFLCKNHPLDDLQLKSLFAKYEKVVEMCRGVTSFKASLCFSGDDGKDRQHIVWLEVAVCRIMENVE